MAKNTDDKFSGLEHECNSANCCCQTYHRAVKKTWQISHSHTHLPKKEEKGKLFDNRPTTQTHTCCTCKAERAGP